MFLSQTNEQAFEYLIEKALVGSTVEEREPAGLGHNRRMDYV